MLHSKLQVSLGYSVSLCHKIKQKQTSKQPSKPSVGAHASSEFESSRPARAVSKDPVSTLFTTKTKTKQNIPTHPQNSKEQGATLVRILAQASYHLVKVNFRRLGLWARQPASTLVAP